MQRQRETRRTPARNEGKCRDLLDAWRERKTLATAWRCRRRSPSSLAKLAQCQGASRAHLQAPWTEGGLRRGWWGWLVVTLPLLPRFTTSQVGANRVRSVPFSRTQTFTEACFLSRPTCDPGVPLFRVNTPAISRRRAASGVKGKTNVTPAIWIFHGNEKPP